MNNWDRYVENGKKTTITKVLLGCGDKMGENEQDEVFKEILCGETDKAISFVASTTTPEKVVDCVPSAGNG